MPHHSYTAEEKELAIDTIEGLRDFLGYAKDILEELKAEAKALPSPQLGVPFVSEATQVFSRLETLVSQYTRIIDLGGFLEDEHTTAMQELYNELVQLQEDLVTAMEYVPSEESLPTKQVYGEASSVSSERKQGTVVPVTTEVEVDSQSVSIREHAFDSEEVRSHLLHLKKRAQTVDRELTNLLEEYQVLSEVTDPEYAEVKSVYIQCATHRKQLRSWVAQIDATVTAPITTVATKLRDDVEHAVSAAARHVKEATETLPEYFDELEHDTQKAVPEVEVSREVQKQPEAFRPSLFAKNELRPFIEAALAVPGNATFLSQYFASPGAFEAYLKRDIDEREKPSKFEKVFGIKHQSAFHALLRDLTLAEIEHLEQLPAAEIRAIVAELDVQYEMYVAWMNAYDVMKDYVQPLPSTSFGEFYVRAMVEDLKSK